MAGTTLTLQQPTKRKRDEFTEGIDIERDTRHQTCLKCTLSWPWVIFHRNEDGSRNVCPFFTLTSLSFTCKLEGSLLMIVGSEDMFYLLRYK